MMLEIVQKTGQGIRFYHPDHLGSTTVVTDLDGEVTQNVAYIPYGEVFVEQRNGTWNTPYLFNAKELDEETGLYYYGARYLDPTGTRWLSVDPLFEKYVGMTPYGYCAGNPVKLVDPDGENIVICDGDEFFIYDPNSSNSYNGNSEVIKNCVAVLDDMYSTKSGSKVLNVLISSSTEHKIKSTGDAYSKGYAVTIGNEVDFGGAFELRSFSHELFHQYQKDKGQGEATYFNEIEAYYFEKQVVTEYNDNLDWDNPNVYSLVRQYSSFDSSRLTNDAPQGKEYEEAAKNIFINGAFNKNNFDKAVNLFKDNSHANSNGLYNKPYYKVKTGNEKYLLESLFGK